MKSMNYQEIEKYMVVQFNSDQRGLPKERKTLYSFATNDGVYNAGTIECMNGPKIVIHIGWIDANQRPEFRTAFFSHSITNGWTYEGESGMADDARMRHRTRHVQL